MKKRLINITIMAILLLSLAGGLATTVLTAPAALAATTHVYSGQSIQAAIDAATAGDTIVVHNGAYNENLTIDKSLTLISDNGSAVTTISSAGGNTILIDASNVTVGTAGHGFTVTGGQPCIGMFPDDGTEMTGVSIVGNVIHDFEGAAIEFIFEGDGTYAFHNNAITDNLIYNCFTGIWLENDGYHSDGDMYENVITGNTIHDYLETGISLVNNGNNDYTGAIRSNNISANAVYNTSGDGEGGGGFGIMLVNNQYYSTGISDNVISGNEVYNCSDTGICLFSWTSSGNISDNNIADNTVYDCNTGIEMLESGSDGEICQNTIADNDVSACDYCIDLYSETATSIHGNTISGNTVHDFPGDGICLESDGGHVYGNGVTGNTVYNSAQGCGILLIAQDNGNTSDNTVSGNTVYQETYTPDSGSCGGIYLGAFSGGVIQNCAIEGNTVYGWYEGIYLDGFSRDTMSYIDILDNTLHDGAGTGNDGGISVDYSSYITIHGNDIAYTYDYGIQVISLDYIDISGNLVHDNYYGIDNHGTIHISGSDYVIICGNDIRDNEALYSAIYVAISRTVTVNCNNIEDNWSYYYSTSHGYDSNAGISTSMAFNIVNADGNWWGDPSGPYYPPFHYGGGDGAYEDVYIDVPNNDWLTEELAPLSDPGIVTAAVPAAISLDDLLFYGGEYYAERNDDYNTGPSYTDLIVEDSGYMHCCEDANVYVNISALLLALLPADFQTSYVDTWDAGTQSTWSDWIDSLREVYMEDTGYNFWDYELSLTHLLFYDGAETALHDFFQYEGGDDDWASLIQEEMRLGDFQVPVHIQTDCFADIIAYIPLTIVDYQLPLQSGWNLRSAPAALDTDWDTWGEIAAAGDGLPGLEAVWTYNASTGLWEEPGMGGAVSPLSAYFIKMSGEDQMGFIISREATAAPTHQLYAGWNLVAPAPEADYEPSEEPWCSYYNVPFPEMWVYDALDSVELAAGGLPGWQTAIQSPVYIDYNEDFYYVHSDPDYDPINLCQDPTNKPEYHKYFWQGAWTALSSGTWWGEAACDPMLLPGGGYWLYMTNPAVLEGYSTTPYYWWDNIEWYDD